MRGINLIKLALGIILAVVVTLLVLQFHRNGHSPAGRFLPDRGQVLPIDPPGSTASGFESPSGYDQVRASVRRVGEQVPKTFAICKAEPVSLWVAYPLHIAYLAVRPLNWLLNRASGFLLALFGVRAATRTDVRGGEELAGLVANSKEHGELQKDQSNMLNNLLEFDQPPVGRVMMRCNAAHCLDVAAGAESSLTLIKESEHSRFPVIDGRNDDAIMGILLARDLCSALLDGEVQPRQDLCRLCRRPLIASESHRMAKLLELMHRRRAHMALVVDAHGAFVGLVTLEDLLAEVVGDICDKIDEEESEMAIHEVGPGR